MYLNELVNDLIVMCIMDDIEEMMKHEKTKEETKNEEKEEIKEKVSENSANESQIEETDEAKVHKDICDGLHETYLAKNNAYGNSFTKSVENYGSISALTRMSDKWNRIENLILNPKTDSNDESLEDSLLDLANYCILTVMSLRKKNNGTDSSDLA